MDRLLEVGNPMRYRNARLYVAGNGVVPQAACRALLTLHERLEG